MASSVGDHYIRTILMQSRQEDTKLSYQCLSYPHIASVTCFKYNKINNYDTERKLPGHERKGSLL